MLLAKMRAALAVVIVCGGLVTAGAVPASALEAPGLLANTGPNVKGSPASGPPTSTVAVSGYGFSAYEAVDIYFDATDEALASTSATGTFSGVTISVPASVVPGTHYITAVGRRSGLSAQARSRVNANWAQFRYSGRHKGFNPYENVLSPSNVSGLDMTWSFTSGSDIDSSPTVANGVVYIGSYDDNVYALKAATGTELWNFTTGDSVASSPAVANGTVYVGSSDGNIYALNATTGAKLWSFPTGAPIFASSPAVANGVVYIGSDDNNIYALNATTGTRLWSFPTGADIAASSPAVANGMVYIGCEDYNLYAFSLASGTAATRRPAVQRLEPNYSLTPQKPRR
jgi:outer membrane protein assembly factor BamB